MNIEFLIQKSDNLILVAKEEGWNWGSCELDKTLFVRISVKDVVLTDVEKYANGGDVQVENGVVVSRTFYHISGDDYNQIALEESGMISVTLEELMAMSIQRVVEE